MNNYKSINMTATAHFIREDGFVIFLETEDFKRALDIKVSPENLCKLFSSLGNVECKTEIDKPTLLRMIFSEVSEREVEIEVPYNYCVDKMCNTAVRRAVEFLEDGEVIDFHKTKMVNGTGKNTVLVTLIKGVK